MSKKIGELPSAGVERAPERQRIPSDAALLLRYMVQFGLPDVALKTRRK